MCPSYSEQRAAVSFQVKDVKSRGRESRLEAGTFYKPPLDGPSLAAQALKDTTTTEAGGILLLESTGKEKRFGLMTASLR